MKNKSDKQFYIFYISFTSVICKYVFVIWTPPARTEKFYTQKQFTIHNTRFSFCAASTFFKCLKQCWEFRLKYMQQRQGSLTWVFWIVARAGHCPVDFNDRMRQTGFHHVNQDCRFRDKSFQFDIDFQSYLNL